MGPDSTHYHLVLSPIWVCYLEMSCQLWSGTLDIVKHAEHQFQSHTVPNSWQVTTFCT